MKATYDAVQRITVKRLRRFDAAAAEASVLERLREVAERVASLDNDQPAFSKPPKPSRH